jgi:hypothetical protein
MHVYPLTREENEECRTQLQGRYAEAARVKSWTRTKSDMPPARWVVTADGNLIEVYYKQEKAWSFRADGSLMAFTTSNTNVV